MPRGIENPVNGTALHHFAVIEHHHVVGHVGHHAQVMRDHEHGHVETRLQVPDQLENLGLDGDVESGGGLVRDQERRAADQRHGDHGALPHAAGQFERIGPVGTLRIGKSDHVQHLDTMAAAVPSGDLLMKVQRFGHLVAHGMER